MGPRRRPPGHPAERVQTDHPRGARRQALVQRLLGQEDRRPRVGERVRQALHGMGGVERQVGPAGREDRQHSQDELGGALGAEPDQHARPDPELRQPARHPARPSRELAVGQNLVTGDQRHRVRTPRRLRREKLVHRGPLLTGDGRRVAPLAEELLPLHRPQQGERRQPRSGVRHHPREQRPPMIEQPDHRRRVEQIDVVFEAAADPAALTALLRSAPASGRTSPPSRSPVSAASAASSGPAARCPRPSARSATRTSPGRSASAPGCAPA